MIKHQFAVKDKIVTVYASEEANRPILYINTFANDSDDLYTALQDGGCSAFTLVSVGQVDWYHDMSPWAIPPISKKDTPCTGGADEYVKLLTESIIPQAEKYVSGIKWRGIVGYSLAGLFAIYCLYRTDSFVRAGSISGSLWFPRFEDYAVTAEMKRKPESVYFSLGDKECKTANPYLKTVQKNTQAIQAYYRQKGIDTVFELNEGNHYSNTVERTAAGIRWLLNR